MPGQADHCCVGVAVGAKKSVGVGVGKGVSEGGGVKVIVDEGSGVTVSEGITGGVGGSSEKVTTRLHALSRDTLIAIEIKGRKWFLIRMADFTLQ